VTAKEAVTDVEIPKEETTTEAPQEFERKSYAFAG
jgi:hypothetical protein